MYYNKRPNIIFLLERKFFSLTLLLAIRFISIYLFSYSQNFNWSLSSLSLDGSPLVRAAHIFAAIKAWWSNPFFWVGFGQLGFVLDLYYPKWYDSTSFEYDLWHSKAVFGGIPSINFIPKLFVEIGAVGFLIIICWGFPAVKSWTSNGKDEGLITAKFALIGFLIAFFGVDGYLYMPAWLIFGAFIGRLRRIDG
jgi:hypothetical protein